MKNRLNLDAIIMSTTKLFEYCIGNVKAVEDSDDFVRFEKGNAKS